MKIRDLKAGDKIRYGVTILEVQFVDVHKKKINALNIITHQHITLPESAVEHMRKFK